MANGTRTLNMTLLDFLNSGRGDRAYTEDSNEAQRRPGMDLTDILTTVSGKPITVEDVLVYLKATGAFRNAIYQMISIEVIMLKAREMKLTVSEHDLHAYSKVKRENLGLNDAVAMNNHCKWLGITFDHWQKEVEIELLRQRLKQALFPNDTIREVYAAHRHELGTLSLSRIVCRERAEVEAVLRRLKAEESDFPTAAREHSLEPNTRAAGGFVGRVKRGMLPADVEKRLFAAKSNELVGPIAQDGYWVLYRLDDVQGTEYTEELKEQIGERLFADWLEREVRNAPA